MRRGVSSHLLCQILWVVAVVTVKGNAIVHLALDQAQDLEGIFHAVEVSKAIASLSHVSRIAGVFLEVDINNLDSSKRSEEITNSFFVD